MDTDPALDSGSCQQAATILVPTPDLLGQLSTRSVYSILMVCGCLARPRAGPIHYSHHAPPCSQEPSSRIPVLLTTYSLSLARAVTTLANGHLRVTAVRTHGLTGAFLPGQAGPPATAASKQSGHQLAKPWVP